MSSEYYIENNYIDNQNYDFEREKMRFFKNISPLLWCLRCFGVYEPKVSDDGPPKKSNFFVWAIILRSFLTGLITFSILNLILSEDQKIEKLYSSLQLIISWICITNNLNNLERSKKIWQNIPATTRLLEISVKRTNYFMIVGLTAIYILLQSN